MIYHVLHDKYPKYTVKWDCYIEYIFYLFVDVLPIKCYYFQTNMEVMCTFGPTESPAGFPATYDIVSVWVWEKIVFFQQISRQLFDLVESQ